MCPICFWEDGLVQFRDPTSCCGTNGVSFAEARENFESIGFLLPRRVWERPRPFSLQDLEEAGREWAEFVAAQSPSVWNRKLPLRHHPDTGSVYPTVEC